MTESPADHIVNDSRVELPLGAIIRDTFTVDSHLGRGQFADVYLVRHRYMGMQAMKVFRCSTDDEEHTAGFNEAFLLSRITHPGIVRVFDANRLDQEYGSAVYITMEYIRGVTLAELLNGEDLSITETIALSIQMADAVAHACQQDPPIVHRDLKPQNILLEDVDETRRVRVCDFGLAKHVNRITETVAAGGTLLYMSPESLVGYGTPASDVYSLGLIIHQMLCHCLPYSVHKLSEATTVQETTKVLDSLQQEIFRPPSYFNSNVSPELDAVVLRSLSYESNERYASATELYDALMICQRCLETVTRGNSAQTESIGTVDVGSAKKAKQALTLAFQLATRPGCERDAREWLEQAIVLDHRLLPGYQVYLDLWSAARRESTD